MMNWQDAVALLVVAACVLAVGAWTWRAARGKGGACGGCSGCATDKATSAGNQPSDPNFVPSDSLQIRR